MGVLGRRHQQGVFEALASANKFQGSGGGNGLFGTMVKVAFASNFNGGYTTTSTTDVVQTGVSAPFIVNRAGFYLITVIATGKVAGGAGTFGYGTVYLNAVNQGLPGALWDKGNGGFTSQTVFDQYLLQPGSYTADWRLRVDNAALTYSHYQTMLQVYVFGT